MPPIRLTALAATLGLSMAMGSLMTLPAAAQTVRYACAATGANDISMGSRYEVRGTGTTARRKFSTEFEAGPTAGFIAGSRLNVLVKGVNVGSMVLEKLLTGDVIGDINFDTRPQADALPFPGNWPAGVGRGTPIVIKKGTTTVLGCRLR
ncbi:MAG: hypothetical protein KDK89_06790 [Alphaproteobacteria bacterium]|nr:hypothetical protein [Alphaproteobacteria bacterium]